MSSPKATNNQVLRSYPVFTECCGGAPTSVTNSCNTINVIFCLFCEGCWFLHKACNTKDINCCDATHVCTTCGKTKGNYSAC